MEPVYLFMDDPGLTVQSEQYAGRVEMSAHPISAVQLGYIVNASFPCVWV